MTHRAILIDPLARTVEEVQQEDGLQQLYDRLTSEKVPVRTIDAVNLGQRQSMYIDDEGALVAGNPTFSFLGSEQVFAGRALIVGTDDEGNDTDTTMSVEILRKQIVFLDVVTTGEFSPGGPVTAPPGFDFAYSTGKPGFTDPDVT